ncbi:MAG: magnesium transporter [Opitutales bacterium TMED158]|nr:MAG: magnesium transporter [Opitutales bacterium TMED158]
MSFPKSELLDGLGVTLDKLDYHYGSGAPASASHVFVYHLTIANRSERRIKLLGRKWIISSIDGEKQVIEGDKIVGEEPDLAPGESFSYNSFHASGDDCAAIGSFHGIDEYDNRIHTLIPRIAMRVPDQSS